MGDRGLNLPKANLKELFLWAIGQRKRFQIEGDSMRPLLKPGDGVLVKTLNFEGEDIYPRLQNSRVRVNDIVLARHPFIKNLILIKKIKSIYEGEDHHPRLHLEGINPDESSDSRGFGSIKKQNIIGRVTSIL